jgi:anti-sigma factor RsiW
MEQTMTNTTSNTQQCNTIGDLLSGYLDGELTQQQSQRVRIHIETCAHCKRLHADLKSMKEQMRQLSYPISDEEVLNALENDLVASSSASVGWTLLIIAGVIAAFSGTTALFLFFAEPGVPVYVKLFNGLLVFGSLALFVSVLRQRLMTYKKDKYRKVKL